MRTKDLEKKNALFEATISMVNEIGFAESSVSKIARRAGVSPSTLYVYHESKEALLISTYIDVKKKINHATMEGFDDTLPIKEIFRKLWYNLFTYLAENQPYYEFAVQFMSSPHIEQVDLIKLHEELTPVAHVFINARDEGIIKNIDLRLLVAFVLSPISRLAGAKNNFKIVMDKENTEIIFNMAWDAIKA